MKIINSRRFKLQGTGIDGHFDNFTKDVLKEPEDDDSNTDEEVQSNADGEI